MGVIRRAIHLIFGPTANKLLDMTNVCRCVWCCSYKDGWKPCENKAEDGERECNWCKGAIAGQYAHCHGLGNALLEAGGRLEGPKQSTE